MTAPDGDVLDRDPKTTGEAAQPVEEQLELPGFARADAADEQEAKEKKRAKEAAALEDYLKWEELEEEIKATFGDKGDNFEVTLQLNNTLQSAKRIYATLDMAVQEGAAIPRVAENSQKNNVDLFLELNSRLKAIVYSEVTNTLNGLKLTTKDPNAAYFVSHTGNGVVSAGQKGIFFHAGLGASALERKPFTQDDARAMALLAFHNRDLLPPNKIKLTGSKLHQSMIKAEIDKLNQCLPEHKQFKIYDPNSPEAKQERGPSLLDKIWGKVTGKPGTDTTTANTQAPQTATAEDNTLDLTDFALPEATTQAPSTFVPLPAESPEATADRNAREEALNLHPEQFLKIAEKVGTIDIVEGSPQDLFKARIQPPASDMTNMKDVLFVQKDDKLKIVAVEGDGTFERLTSPPEQKLASDLNKGFGAAGQGETPVVTQDDENFIGPRTPGWTPPSPPSA